jgi:hypothetical protein
VSKPPKGRLGQRKVTHFPFLERGVWLEFKEGATTNGGALRKDVRVLERVRRVVRLGFRLGF